MKYEAGAIINFGSAVYVWSPLAYYGGRAPCYVTRYSSTREWHEWLMYVVVPVGIDGLEFA